MMNTKNQDPSDTMMAMNTEAPVKRDSNNRCKSPTPNRNKRAPLTSPMTLSPLSRTSPSPLVQRRSVSPRRMAISPMKHRPTLSTVLSSSILMASNNSPLAAAGRKASRAVQNFVGKVIKVSPTPTEEQQQQIQRQRSSRAYCMSSLTLPDFGDGLNDSDEEDDNVGQERFSSSPTSLLDASAKPTCFRRTISLDTVPSVPSRRTSRHSILSQDTNASNTRTPWPQASSESLPNMPKRRSTMTVQSQDTKVSQTKTRTPWPQASQETCPSMPLRRSTVTIHSLNATAGA